MDGTNGELARLGRRIEHMRARLRSIRSDMEELAKGFDQAQRSMSRLVQELNNEKQEDDQVRDLPSPLVPYWETGRPEHWNSWKPLGEKDR